VKSFLTAICLTVVLALGTVSAAWSADSQKGVAAYKSGDYATALREWTPLAKQGDASAQSILGVMYDKGLGVPQDYKTAMKWWTLAAKQGYALAQYNLGWMYSNGKGVPQDYKTAVKWYTLVAEQGDADAQNNLGWMYDQGKGVLQDYVRAHMWYNIATSSGNSKNASKNRPFWTSFSLVQLSVLLTG
jgi:hypothetical protein